MPGIIEKDRIIRRHGDCADFIHNIVFGHFFTVDELVLERHTGIFGNSVNHMLNIVHIHLHAFANTVIQGVCRNDNMERAGK